MISFGKLAGVYFIRLHKDQDFPVSVRNRKSSKEDFRGGFISRAI
mgnify:CR=1 FL=1